MAKAAQCTFFWKKSPSSDIVKNEVIILCNGAEYKFETGPEVEQIAVTVRASRAFSFTIKSFDAEGNEVVSASFSGSVGDLEAPLPATDLGFSVNAVVEVPDDHPDISIG